MERIRQLRRERGLSQVKLAVLADMDPATLNRLEQGKGNPNLRTLERVAAALDLEVADLLGKAPAPPSAQRTLFNGGEEERRAVRQSEQIEQAARALKAAWLREMPRDEFTTAEYDEAGAALYALDAFLASAMTEALISDEDSVSEGYRTAFNRAFRTLEDLRDTLQRARSALEARGVADLNEYRELRAVQPGHASVVNG